MAVLWLILCVAVIFEAMVAGWDFKYPGNLRWGIFWLSLSIVSFVLVITTRDVFVGGGP